MKLGIDFGTCFSFTAACTGHNGLPISLVGSDTENIYDPNGGIPTVFYNDAGKEIMGRKALGLCAQFTENGVTYIKKDIRDKCPPNKNYTLGGTRYSAKNIIVKFIQFLINNAVNEIKYQYPGENPNPENIAVAVPAMSESPYREFMRECAVEASGLDVEKIDLIDEPVAAALSFYATRKSADENLADGSCILTYDLGGGTFDTAIVEYNSSKRKKFTVKVQSGDTKTGGTDWDNALLKYIKENHKPNADLKKLTPNDEFNLLQAVIDAKILLSSRESITFSRYADDAAVNFRLQELTRQKFEELTKNLLDKSIMVVHDVIKAYRKKFGNNAKIDAIVLSGGASRMPKIKQRLQEEFPGMTIHMERPDRAIAFGAAIYAADIQNTQMVAPHTYGVDSHIQEMNNKRMISNILFKGTPIKDNHDGRYISSRSTYYPIKPDQTGITFEVYESDEPNGADWIDIGSRKPMFEITIPIKKVRDIETERRSFDVEFRLIQGGILELHVYDRDQNNKEVFIKKHQL